MVTTLATVATILVTMALITKYVDYWSDDDDE